MSDADAMVGTGRRRALVDELYDVMRCGGAWSLVELCEALKARGRPSLQTAVSARLREMPRRHSARLVRVTIPGSRAPRYELRSGDGRYLYEVALGVTGGAR